jgi:NAD-dependent deacetylase
VLRPDVILFGELLPQEKLREVSRQLHDGFDLVLSVGTSSLFPYIAEPVLIARTQGVPTVEINPGDTVVSQVVEYRIQAGAADALDLLWDRYRELQGLTGGP